MRRVVLYATAGAFIALVPASAMGEKVVPSTTAGVGAATCATFSAAYRVNLVRTEEAYFAWGQGYMSAFNTMLSGAGNQMWDLLSMPVDDQKRFMRTFCDDHPDAPYVTGILQMMQHMSPATVPRNSN